MVKSTFLNLPEAKKARITEVLLEEFSTYPLTDAKVSRIVKDAEIARGAFYKYFDDLTDAYLYIFRIAIKEIHAGFRSNGKFDPEFFYQSVKDFVEKTQNSRFQPLMKLHMLRNESVLGVTQMSPKNSLKLNPEFWVAMVLSHDTINACFNDPELSDEFLDRLKKSLDLIDKGMK